MHLLFLHLEAYSSTNLVSFVFQFENLVLRPWTFFPIFCQINQRFEIRDTRFLEVLISYQMKIKNSNVLPLKLLPMKFFKNFQNKRKTQKLYILQKKKKKTKNKNLFFTFHTHVPNFRALGPVIIIQNRFGPLKIKFGAALSSE